MMGDPIQVCLAHGTFSYIEDDCPSDESEHDYHHAYIEIQ